MKNILLTILLLLFASNGFSQSSYIKNKGYEGYIFSKEHSIWGFPPEKNRYTPSEKDVMQAEKILRDSINTEYVQQNHKPIITKKTLRKHIRQYVGYLTDNNEIVIHIYLSRDVELNELCEDVILVMDGGSNYWSIKINLFTKELFDISVNGIS